MKWKILEQVIITKKCPQRKTLHILKTDVLELSDTKNIGKVLIKLISFFNYIKYWYYNTSSLQLYCLPRQLNQISLWKIGTLFQRNPHPVLHQFPCFLLPHSTTCHNYWKYQTICQAKPIKFMIKLSTDHNTFLVKHATYQKVESLRATSLSKLENMVNSNSIFNTNCPEFSTKW